MKTWEIWCEGYRDNGGGQGASLLGTEEGETFDDAMRVHLANQSDVAPYPGGTAPRDYYRRGDDGNWRMWGCQIYDNETDARKNDAYFLR